jgi:hypothetical protein
MVIQRMAGRQRLGVGDVERGARELAGVQGGDQGRLVDQGAPADVDQVQPPFGAGQHLGIDHVPRFGGGGRGDHEVVALREQSPRLAALDAGQRNAALVRRRA